MIRDFYRSLDRDINIFGLRGGWVRNFLILAGCSLVLALIIGAITSVGMGFAVFLVGGIGSFFLCIVLQQKLPSRQIEKFRAQQKMRCDVVRRQTLCRIVYEGKEIPREDVLEKKED